MRQRDDDIDIAFAQFRDQRPGNAAAYLKVVVRPALAELGDGPRQQRAGEIARQADADGLHLRRGLGQADDLVVERDHAPRMAHHRLALARQHDARRAAIEQIAGEHALQPLHLRAHGRLGNTQHLGGLGETADIHDSQKGAQKIGRNIQCGTPPSSHASNLPEASRRRTQSVTKHHHRGEVFFSHVNPVMRRGMQLSAYATEIRASS